MILYGVLEKHERFLRKLSQGSNVKMHYKENMKCLIILDIHQTKLQHFHFKISTESTCYMIN